MIRNLKRPEKRQIKRAIKKLQEKLFCEMYFGHEDICFKIQEDIYELEKLLNAKIIDNKEKEIESN